HTFRACHTPLEDVPRKRSSEHPVLSPRRFRQGRGVLAHAGDDSLLEWGVCDRRTLPHLQLPLSPGARAFAGWDRGCGDVESQPYIKPGHAAVERDRADLLAGRRRGAGVTVDPAGVDGEAALPVPALRLGGVRLNVPRIFRHRVLVRWQRRIPDSGLADDGSGAGHHWGLVAIPKETEKAEVDRRPKGCPPHPYWRRSSFVTQQRYPRGSVQSCACGP